MNPPATVAATMTVLRPASPHAVAATAIAAAALTGATVGWILMRVAYRLDRLAAPDGAGDPVWSLTWTDASFPFTMVALVVGAFTVLFAALAAAVVLAHQASTRDITRQRRILATGTTTPLLRRPAVPDAVQPPNRGAHPR
ncbi:MULTISPECIES: hypothetical protein [unclassified Rhodococcus (in: high G+C Gram-positive bacteria)]|uniref:hypothetical protein n=1 Tax=unclassified Rhodococcus (in: high G+C Gram-positive bacteria) TaxID=192944 RepID=UPI00146F1781|nr:MULTISPECIES: hypothetical protein [unclassified Rhodococcus (in: high G+C Gram-positive bacteria)]NLU65040.1 hypothetical protein [Rhodococcus sp. HNM0563]WSE25808.1 hypothetical protein U9J23_26690 [Rhodococcus sp. PD04]